jgi:hypothetical protein
MKERLRGQGPNHGHGRRRLVLRDLQRLKTARTSEKSSAVQVRECRSIHLFRVEYHINANTPRPPGDVGAVIPFASTCGTCARRATSEVGGFQPARSDGARLFRLHKIEAINTETKKCCQTSAPSVITFSAHKAETRALVSEAPLCWCTRGEHKARRSQERPRAHDEGRKRHACFMQRIPSEANR